MNGWWVALTGLVALCDGSAGLLAVATLVAAGLAGVFLACYLSGLFGTGAPERVTTVALRDRARRPTYVRLSDPDAAGRPRPRAPSVNLVYR